VTTDANTITAGGFYLTLDNNDAGGTNCFDINTEPSVIISELESLNTGNDVAMEATRVGSVAGHWRVTFTGLDVSGGGQDIFVHVGGKCAAFTTDVTGYGAAVEVQRVQDGGVLLPGTPYFVRITPTNGAGLGDGW